MKLREIEEGNSLVSQVKSLLSMVIESYSVGVFFDFSVDKHVILPGPQNLVSVTFPDDLGLHLSLMSLVSA